MAELSPYRPSTLDVSRGQFSATLGKAELEQGAALLARVCAVLGDRWEPHTFEEVAEVFGRDVLNGVAPWHRLVTNPFWRPDLRALAERGFATITEQGICLTAEAISRIAERWWAPWTAEDLEPLPFEELGVSGHG